MAHERTELELGPGVNALTGPNNSGKSAVVEALRCVATNPRPKPYIRHGAKEARVGLEFEDGTRVVWVRKKRSSGYELWAPGAEEPEEYWKFGRKPPEDILNVLRLDLVELETGNEVDVHVGNQREPVFLLNQPGSNAAAFFAASTESAHLLAMQNLLKRKTMDAKREKKGLEARLDDIEGQLDLFAPLPSIGVELEAARELENAANKLQGEIPALEGLISARQNLEQTLHARSATATILNGVESAPIINATNELAGILSLLAKVDEKREKAVAASSVLSTLSLVPPIENTARLATLCNHLQQVDHALVSASRTGRTMEDLKEPPICADISQLSQIIDMYYVTRSRSGREKLKHDILRNLAEPPEVKKDERLEALVVELRRAEEGRSGAAEALKELESRLKLFEEQVAQRVEALGHCPTCGSDMNGLAFLDRGHRHDA